MCLTEAEFEYRFLDPYAMAFTYLRNLAQSPVAANSSRYVVAEEVGRHTATIGVTRLVGKSSRSTRASVRAS